MAEPQESQHTGESGGKYRLAEAVKRLMARQSLEDITVKEITGEKHPAILTGDFNVDQYNEIYQTFAQSNILKDSYTYARQRFAENGTFNSFNPYLMTDSRIDHVFVSPKFEVENYGVMTSTYWTTDEHTTEGKGHDAPREIGFKTGKIRLPSDHYPVFVRLNFKK